MSMVPPLTVLLSARPARDTRLPGLVQDPPDQSAHLLQGEGLLDERPLHTLQEHPRRGAQGVAGDEAGELQQVGRGALPSRVEAGTGGFRPDPVPEADVDAPALPDPGGPYA